ncbi:unnamed protein product [Blepharisma stoltei]|uniref:Protein kinase domain-containing protein n=1 Tax=Blepharisma stoltei TaxID=1481888 RepID=A0AAU9IMK8_9CILI|nr:unnamed protein product [Blepharisma stoltei]
MGCCSSKETETSKKNLESTTTELLRSEIEDKAELKSTPISKRSQTTTKLPPRRYSRGLSTVDRKPKNFTKEKAQAVNPSPQNTFKDSTKQYIKKFSKTPLRQHFSTIKKKFLDFNDSFSLVNDKRTGVKKIIKEVKKSDIFEGVYDNFIKEIQNFQRLDHPNIVKLYDIYELGDNFFLVYEYLPGLSLADKIHHESIGYSLASTIMRDILSGLNHCHGNDIPHLGINFGKININTKEGNIIKLLGFTYPWEIKKKVEANKATCYMGPEILNKNYSLFASDIWSLGVILYTIVQGKLPYKGKNVADLKNEYKKEIVFEGNDWAFTSDELKDLLSKMLEYDYKKRITAADALNHPWIKNNKPPSLTPKD